MELCPTIRASVQASHPDPSRVRKVCRNEYSTNGVIGAPQFFLASAFAVRNALVCCFFKLESYERCLDVDAASFLTTVNKFTVPSRNFC
jgi:hypothetical protein